MKPVTPGLRHLVTNSDKFLGMIVGTEKLLQAFGRAGGLDLRGGLECFLRLRHLETSEMEPPLHHPGRRAQRRGENRAGKHLNSVADFSQNVFWVPVVIEGELRGIQIVVKLEVNLLGRHHGLPDRLLVFRRRLQAGMRTVLLPRKRLGGLQIFQVFQLLLSLGEFLSKSIRFLLHSRQFFPLRRGLQFCRNICFLRIGPRRLFFGQLPERFFRLVPGFPRLLTLLFRFEFVPLSQRLLRLGLRERILGDLGAFGDFPK